MKDNDAIAREIHTRHHIFVNDTFDRKEISEIVAILRKHDEAKASGEHPMTLPRTLAGGVTKFISIRRDSEGDACGWNFETEKAAQWIAAQLAQSRPAPKDESKESGR